MLLQPLKVLSVTPKLLVNLFLHKLTRGYCDFSLTLWDDRRETSGSKAWVWASAPTGHGVLMQRQLKQHEEGLLHVLCAVK